MAISTGEHLLRSVTGMLMTILLLGWLLKRFRQPYFVAYILAGVLLGPGAFRVFTDVETITQIGILRLIMQMFFIGTEIEAPLLVNNGKTLIIGTLVQLLLSLTFMWITGNYLAWRSEQIILFGFIISLSSSSIILDYLKQNKEIDTRLGTITTGILIMQDFLIVPMILILNFLADQKFDIESLIFQVAVTVPAVILLRKVALQKDLRLPFDKLKEADHELQVFVGLLLCFGFAWITSALNLSAAFGAMFAGLLVSKARSTQWLERNLIPFRIFFLSVFFFSIGLQIDFNFVKEHFGVIGTLVIVILLINSLINAIVFRLLGETWKNSVYAGALLSQIGEFSLVLCAVAAPLGLLDNYSLQLTLAVVSLTMLVTAAWISVIKRFLFQNRSFG